MGEGEDNKKEDEGKKKSAPRTLHVTVLRAVDKYHHRGAKITVPNDDYHRGLIKLGLLREEV